MTQCDYWFTTENKQLCDLSSEACKCFGKEKHCSQKAKSINSMKDEDDTLHVIADRSRKHRSLKLAS